MNFLKSRAILSVALLVPCLMALGQKMSQGMLHHGSAGRNPPALLIGYTEYTANLPGGRHPNIITMRACLVRADGTGRRVVAEELSREPNTWTQFGGWTPDGQTAIVAKGWESPENAAWEEKHKEFRMTEGWRFDSYFVNLKTGQSTNITGIERVSDYNSGVFFWPEKTNQLGFQALIKGDSHPYAMDLDGRNKRDLLKVGTKGFAYGFHASPDGKLVTYHKDYHVFIADADGSHPKEIKTGNPFNFMPAWSGDGQWLLFVSGEHYNCHPYLVRRDGTGLRKAGDRGGYIGAISALDVPDFHDGSSDTPVWGKDSRSFYYTAKVGSSVELLRGTVDGETKQLTHSAPNTLNYHPTPSPDGQWLILGSTRTGTRQLYLLPAEGGELRPLTHVAPGHAAMFGGWQPDDKKH